MKRWTSWLSLLVIITLLTACGADAARYIKDEYPLVSVDGKGSNLSKVYAVEGKNVPTVANELAAKETPKEKSKDSEDQMFLVYNDKVINIQKDPSENNNTLIQLDSIEYAKSHYDSSFLQGYLTATFSNRYSEETGITIEGPMTIAAIRKHRIINLVRVPLHHLRQIRLRKPTTSDRTGGFTSGAANPSSGSNSTTPKERWIYTE